MKLIIKNIIMVNNEVMELKNNYLKDLREIESKFDKKLENQSIILDNNNKELEKKLDLALQKNEQLYDTMINEKVKLEKLSELYTFQNKVNDMLISHEMRINNLLNDNKKLSQSLDRIITDNLKVPGYIGSSCTYKNLSEYIQYNIIELQKLKNNKEIEKKNSDDIKNKLDNFMKNMFNLVDNSVTRSKEYTDSKHQYIEKLLDNKLVEFSEKNMELRTQIFANMSKITNQIENYENKLNNLRGEILNDFENKFNEFKNEYEEDKNNFKKDIDEMKNSLNDLIDEKIENFFKKQKINTKDLKTKKNDINLSPNVKTFRNINKKDDLINSYKRINNINIVNKINNESKNKLIKRKTVFIPEIKNDILLKIKNNENKSSKESDDSSKSDDKSSSKNDADDNLFKEVKIKNINEDKKENNEEKSFKENNKIENKNNNEQNYNDKNNDKDINNDDNKLNNNDNKDKNDNINNNRNEFYKKEEISDTTFSQNEILSKINIPKIMTDTKNSEIKNNNNNSKNINNIYNYNLFNTSNKAKKSLERNINKNKSSSNILNILKMPKKKEKELKTINSDRSIFDYHIYNNSPKCFNIKTQTPKVILTNKKKKLNFASIGFNYKVVNLGSNINFRETDSKTLQKMKENSKINIDLSSPMTYTYKEYQKKKNVKKINKKIPLNKMSLNKCDDSNKNIILPSFKTTNSFYNIKNKKNNNNIKYFQNIDYDYSNLIKKNSEVNNSLETNRSYKVKKKIENK